MSGRLDPITPPSFATLAHQSLEQSANLVIEGFGHGASVHSECGRKLVLEHLTNPEAALDTDCLGDYEIPFESLTFSSRAGSRLVFDTLTLDTLPSL